MITVLDGRAADGQNVCLCFRLSVIFCFSHNRNSNCFYSETPRIFFFFFYSIVLLKMLIICLGFEHFSSFLAIFIIFLIGWCEKMWANYEERLISVVRCAVSCLMTMKYKQKTKQCGVPRKTVKISALVLLCFFFFSIEATNVRLLFWVRNHHWADTCLTPQLSPNAVYESLYCGGIVA